MRVTKNSALIAAVMVVLAAGCGDDDLPATDGGGSVPIDSGGGSGDSGSGTLGCAMGTPCGTGLMCCSGVPYPTEGICMTSCPAVSDRARKEAIRPVDGDAILAELVTLPISEWSYRGEQSVRHVGPMAQDFRAAFGLGESDKTIHPVDESGVTMAAVQALYRRVADVERDNRTLREENQSLSRRMRTIERRRHRGR